MCVWELACYLCLAVQTAPSCWWNQRHAGAPLAWRQPAAAVSAPRRPARSDALFQQGARQASVPGGSTTSGYQQMMWRDGTSIATPGCQTQLTLTGGRATWKPCSGRCCLRLQLSSTQDSFTVCVPHLGWLSTHRRHAAPAPEPGGAAVTICSVCCLTAGSSGIAGLQPLECPA